MEVKTRFSCQAREGDMSRRCDQSMHSIEARLAAWWMLKPTHNPPRTPSARRPISTTSELCSYPPAGCIVTCLFHCLQPGGARFGSRPSPYRSPTSTPPLPTCGLTASNPVSFRSVIHPTPLFRLKSLKPLFCPTVMVRPFEPDQGRHSSAESHISGGG